MEVRAMIMLCLGIYLKNATASMIEVGRGGKSISMEASGAAGFKVPR